MLAQRGTLDLQGKLILDDLVSAKISLSEVNGDYEKLKDPEVTASSSPYLHKDDVVLPRT